MAADRRADRATKTSSSISRYGATVRALRAASRPQLTIRSGWIRIRGVGSLIASPRPRISIPRGRHGSVLARSSMTIAARPDLATSRNFFDRSSSRPPTSMVARRVVDPSDRDHVRRAVGADRRDPSELKAAGQVLQLGLTEDAHRPDPAPLKHDPVTNVRPKLIARPSQSSPVLSGSTAARSQAESWYRIIAIIVGIATSVPAITAAASE
jgi:hypothetical protein